MRPLIVVSFDEVIEAFLLLKEVEGGRLCGFPLEGEMHAFMTAPGSSPGQAELFERPLKHGKGEIRFCRSHAFTSQQIPRPVIADGQRIAVLLVAELELPLVIGTPKPVGLGGCVERRAFRLIAPAFAADHQAVAIEHRMNRADCRRLDHRELPDQLVTDLRCPPGRVFALEPQNAALDLELPWPD